MGGLSSDYGVYCLRAFEKVVAVSALRKRDRAATLRTRQAWGLTAAETGPQNLNGGSSVLFFHHSSTSVENVSTYAKKRREASFFFPAKVGESLGG